MVWRRGWIFFFKQIIYSSDPGDLYCSKQALWKSLIDPCLPSTFNVSEAAPFEQSLCSAGALFVVWKQRFHSRWQLPKRGFQPERVLNMRSQSHEATHFVFLDCNFSEDRFLRETNCKKFKMFHHCVPDGKLQTLPSAHVRRHTLPVWPPTFNKINTKNYWK